MLLNEKNEKRAIKCGEFWKNAFKTYFVGNLYGAGRVWHFN